MIYPLAVLSIPLLILAGAFFYARLVHTAPQTIAESIVRWLFLLARWMEALARAADSSVIAYREHLSTEKIRPLCESFRPWEGSHAA